MIELRHRPQCSDCSCRVSSDAPGCDRCGYLLLCSRCDDLHQRKHAPENGGHPGYPAAGYTLPEVLDAERLASDPREPHPTRDGFWALHNCAKCDDGRKSCPFRGLWRGGTIGGCEWPRARND